MSKPSRNQKPVKRQSSIFGSFRRGTSSRASSVVDLTYQHEADTTKSSPLARSAVQHGRNPPIPPNDTTPPRVAEAPGHAKPNTRRTPSIFGTFRRTSSRSSSIVDLTSPDVTTTTASRPPVVSGAAPTSGPRPAPVGGVKRRASSIFGVFRHGTSSRSSSVVDLPATSSPLAQSTIPQSNSSIDSTFIRNEESPAASSAPTRGLDTSPNSASIGHDVQSSTTAERTAPTVAPATTEQLHGTGHIEGAVEYEGTPVAVPTPQLSPEPPLAAENITESSPSPLVPSAVATEDPVPTPIAEIPDRQSPTASRQILSAPSLASEPAPIPVHETDRVAEIRTEDAPVIVQACETVGIVGATKTAPNPSSVTDQSTSRTEAFAVPASLDPFSDPARETHTIQNTQCSTAADQAEEAPRRDVPVILSTAESPLPDHVDDESNGVSTAAIHTSEPASSPGQVKDDWIVIPTPPPAMVNETRAASAEGTHTPLALQNHGQGGVPAAEDPVSVPNAEAPPALVDGTKVPIGVSPTPIPTAYVPYNRSNRTGRTVRTRDRSIHQRPSHLPKNARRVPSAAGWSNSTQRPEAGAQFPRDIPLPSDTASSTTGVIKWVVVGLVGSVVGLVAGMLL